MEVASGTLGPLYMDIDYDPDNVGTASFNPTIEGKATLQVDSAGSFYDELMADYGTDRLQLVYNSVTPPITAENSDAPVEAHYAIYDFDISVSPASDGVITGTVGEMTAGNWSPIEGAEVWVEIEDEEIVAETGEDGNYELYLPYGTYQVGVRAYDYITVLYDENNQAKTGTLEWKDATDLILSTNNRCIENIDIILQQGGTITGTITDAAGVALSDTVDIDCIRTDGPKIGFGWENPNSQFTIDGLPTGTYDIYAAIPGMADFAEDINVTAPEATSGINIRINQPVITRANAARMLAEKLGLESSTPAVSPFTDVDPDHSDYGYICTMEEIGYMNGVEEGYFKPDNNVSRAEFATLIDRAFDIDDYTPVTPSFADVNDEHWAYKSIENICHAGIMSGYTKNQTEYFFDDKDVTTTEATACLDAISGDALKKAWFDKNMFNPNIYEEQVGDAWSAPEIKIPIRTSDFDWNTEDPGTLFEAEIERMDADDWWPLTLSRDDMDINLLWATLPAGTLRVGEYEATLWDLQNDTDIDEFYFWIENPDHPVISRIHPSVGPAGITYGGFELVGSNLNAFTNPVIELRTNDAVHTLVAISSGLESEVFVDPIGHWINARLDAIEDEDGNPIPIEAGIYKIVINDDNDTVYEILNNEIQITTDAFIFGRMFPDVVPITTIEEITFDIPGLNFCTNIDTNSVTLSIVDEAGATAVTSQSLEIKPGKFGKEVLGATFSNLTLAPGDYAIVANNAVILGMDILELEAATRPVVTGVYMVEDELNPRHFTIHVTGANLNWSDLTGITATIMKDGNQVGTGYQVTAGTNGDLEISFSTTAPDGGYEIMLFNGYQKIDGEAWFEYQTVQLNVETVNAQPGTSVTVPITIENAAGLTGMQFTIDYDKTVADPTEITLGSEFSDQGFFLMDNIDEAALGSFNGAFIPSIDGDIKFFDKDAHVILLNVEFDILANAQGSGYVNLLPREGSFMVDVNSVPMPYNVNNGEIIVDTTPTSADLTELTLSAGTLNPAFGANITSYTANVINDVTFTNVIPITADPAATVTVNDVVYDGVNPIQVDLNVGSNPIAVKVTPAVGADKTYTVTVTPEEATPTSADLTGLTLSAGTLNPAFDANITSYTANVINDVTFTNVTPNVADPAATVIVNDTVYDGATPIQVDLKVGPNLIAVKVTPVVGADKTYTVMVNREARAPVGQQYFLQYLVNNSGEFNEILAVYTLDRLTVTVPTLYLQRIAKTYTDTISNFIVTADSEVAKVDIVVNGNHYEMIYKGSNIFERGISGLTQGSDILFEAYDNEGTLLESKIQRLYTSTYEPVIPTSNQYRLQELVNDKNLFNAILGVFTLDQLNLVLPVTYIQDAQLSYTSEATSAMVLTSADVYRINIVVNEQTFSITNDGSNQFEKSLPGIARGTFVTIQAYDSSNQLLEEVVRRAL